MNIFICIYWIIAFLASGLFGYYAIEIFTDVKENQKPVSWIWHQRWFNFFGSLVGWVALWVLVRRYWNCILGECTIDLNSWDLLAGFIAFVGITGYLPFTVYGLISSVYLVGIKLADLFPKSSDK